jgi:hypothetical protein
MKQRAGIIEKKYLAIKNRVIEGENEEEIFNKV